MPNWSVAEILAVHFRMHKAEGVLFRDALARAAGACGVRFVRVPEKQLDEYAERALSTSMNGLAEHRSVTEEVQWDRPGARTRRTPRSLP